MHTHDFDYVLIARRPALDAAFAALVSDLVRSAGARARRASRSARPSGGRQSHASLANTRRPTPISGQPVQDQENQKNLLLAIVLSMAVLLCVAVLLRRAARRRSRSARRAFARSRRKAKEQAAGAPRSRTGAAAQHDRARRPHRHPSVRPRGPPGGAEALARAWRIETPSLSRDRSRSRADASTIWCSPSIARRSIRRAPTSSCSRRRGAPHPYYAEFGWTAGQGVTQPMPNHNTLWRSRRAAPSRPARPVTLVWDNGQGLVFRRTISVDRRLPVHGRGRGGEQDRHPVSLYPYALISRHGLPKLDGFWMILHEGFIGAVGDSGLKEVGYADVLKDGGTKTYKQTRRLAGLHRQVLGRRPGPRSDRAHRGALPRQQGHVGGAGLVPGRRVRGRRDRARRQGAASAPSCSPAPRSSA